MTKELTEDNMKNIVAMLGQLQTGPAQDWLSDEQYFGQLDGALAWAKKCIEDDGAVPHVWYLHGRHRRNDDWIMLPIMFSDWPPPNSKYVAMQGVGAVFLDKHSDYMLMNAVHVSETWMADYPLGSLPKDGFTLPKGTKMPSERADKMEALTVTATSMDQRMSQCHLEMLRDTDGAFSGWGREMVTRYDPTAEATNPRDVADLLAINIFMGYFEASRRKSAGPAAGTV